MPKATTVLGIITARGGSKGIPRKNIRTLSGKPLIAYTIEAAKSSRLLTRVIVSTDDEEIADIARSLGAEVPFLRPGALAADDSTSVDVVNHALDWLRQNEMQEFDYAMILQPTSPLRTAADIDACITIAQEKGPDSVMSMVEIPDFAVEKLKRIEDGRVLPLLKDEGPQSARRGKERVYKRNTAIYLTKTERLRAGDLFGAVSLAYVMPRERSVDINEPADWDMAEFLLTRPR